jgi:hypothetical protein
MVQASEGTAQCRTTAQGGLRGSSRSSRDTRREALCHSETAGTPQRSKRLGRQLWWLLSALVGGVSAACGWHTQHPARIVACGFPSLDAAEVTAKQFRDVYEGKQPILIRGGVKHWPAQTLWTKSHLSDMFRNMTVLVKGPSEDPAFSPIISDDDEMARLHSAVRWPDYMEKMSQRQCGATLNASDFRCQMGSRMLGLALARVIRDHHKPWLLISPLSDTGQAVCFTTESQLCVLRALSRCRHCSNRCLPSHPTLTLTRTASMGL